MLRRLLMTYVLPVLVIVGMPTALWAAQASEPKSSAPWPGPTLTVAVKDLGWLNVTAQAVSKINQTGVKITLRLTRDVRSADVLVRSLTREQMDAACVPWTEKGKTVRCEGYATHIGYRGRQESVMLVGPDGASAHDRDAVQLVTHELLHILGLRHRSDVCATINRDTGEDLCWSGPPMWNRCGPAPADVDELTKLYGRRPVTYSPLCPTFTFLAVPAWKSPTYLTASGRWVSTHRWTLRPSAPVSDDQAMPR